MYVTGRHPGREHPRWRAAGTCRRRIPPVPTPPVSADTVCVDPVPPRRPRPMPQAPLRIAVLSAWHVHAEEYGRAVLDHPDTELVGVWDDDAERGAALAETLGTEFVADLDALLAREDLDGVTVTTATTVHREVLGKVIAAGKHIFTEKLLAPTVAECEDRKSVVAGKAVACGGRGKSSTQGRL